MKGYCVVCNDNILKDVIGKREKAKCNMHYWSGLRQIAEPISKKSDTQKARDAKYYPIRNKFVDENPYCLIRVEGCTRFTSCVHHSKGKEGDLYFAVEFFIPTCLTCHRWAEDHPEAARELGVSLFKEK